MELGDKGEGRFRMANEKPILKIDETFKRLQSFIGSGRKELRLKIIESAVYSLKNSLNILGLAKKPLFRNKPILGRKRGE